MGRLGRGKMMSRMIWQVARVAELILDMTLGIPCAMRQMMSTAPNTQRMAMNHVRKNVVTWVSLPGMVTYDRDLMEGLTWLANAFKNVPLSQRD